VRILAASVPLAALGFLNPPAYSQTTCGSAPTSITAPFVTGARDFYDNFAVPSVIAGNAIQLQGTSAANAAGDLNSTYFQFYYSLKNLAVWEAQTGYCLELVLVGDFPEVRYFTVAVNDEHYSLAQHILDADIDPAVSEANGGYNPFTPNQPNPGTYPYLVPISLGQVPAQPPGTARCGSRRTRATT